ncbi:hypothetical protein B0H14DRAFT_3156774 [Mycena olivaceomarginata]|nr:hypothetical protein B0H14DRAFT_3156774 [Mycena olivaceomarginata]
MRQIPEFREENVTGEYFWRETKNGTGTDLEWGRRRATRVEGTAAEVEGYRQFAARRKFFHPLFGGRVWSRAWKGGQGRVEQEGRREIGRRRHWRTGWHGRRGIGKSGGEVAEMGGGEAQNGLRRRIAQEDLLLLRKAIESKDTEMALLHRSVEAAKEDAQDRALEGQLRGAEGELEKAREGKRVLEAALTRREVEVRELIAEKTEQRDVLEELAAKTADLVDAQTRLQGEDRLTDQAVLVLVQALNTEIRETAAFLADSFEFEEKNPDAATESDSKEMGEVHERATEILGHGLVDILRSSDHHDDPAFVHLAFQCGMIEYARWMSASWFFEDPEDEQLLADIYQRARASQDQELIYGTPELGDYFVDAFVNVLLTASFKSNSAALHALIAKRFSDRIAALVRLALELNKAVGTEVTACELKTLSVAPGVPFDAETMVDVVDGAGQASEAVLCTCELGLPRSDKVDGAWTRSILLKPKVVLPSGVEELLAQGGNTPTRTAA